MDVDHTHSTLVVVAAEDMCNGFDELRALRKDPLAEEYNGMLGNGAGHWTLHPDRLPPVDGARLDPQTELVGVPDAVGQVLAAAAPINPRMAARLFARHPLTDQASSSMAIAAVALPDGRH